jgi:hypothetical protein
MPRRLVANITMMSDDGVVVHLPVGTSEKDVPAWAMDRISNPLVWDAPVVEVAPVVAPPKSGAGSGAAAWVDYARAMGLDVTEDAKRDDVIAACEAAGVPTE